jgi:acyl-CoA thioesterase-1
MVSMAAAYGVPAAVRKALATAMIAWAVLAGGAACHSVAARAAAAPIRLLVLGDSLTAGYGLPHEDGFQARLAAALRAQGRDVRIVDGAVSGDTSAGGRARLDWTLGGGVDAAIVELGANDGLRGLDPGQMEANLTAILDALAARHIPVLFSGMYAPPNFGQDYEKAFRAVFDRLGRRPGLIYDPFFLDGVAMVPSLTQPGGLHPNAEGVRREVARLLPLVDRLLDEART